MWTILTFEKLCLKKSEYIPLQSRASHNAPLIDALAPFLLPVGC